jgi:hypothetical protein
LGITQPNILKIISDYVKNLEENYTHHPTKTLGQGHLYYELYTCFMNFVEKIPMLFDEILSGYVVHYMLAKGLFE